ncbi:hypothetical protein AB3G45_17080 [Shinella sp. S4-D37]|uniref:hypothetical protein n=1 Tax=Shinella sp. S4-D37 TaxID=3161999 RepID=UPI0034654B09
MRISGNSGGNDIGWLIVSLGAVPRVCMSVSLRPVCGGKWTFRRFPEGVANSGKKVLRFRHIFSGVAVVFPSSLPQGNGTLTRKKGPVMTPGLILAVPGPADQNLIFSEVEIAVTRSLSKS